VSGGASDDKGDPASDESVRPLGVAIVTVSDTRTPSTDRSGDLAAELVEAAGHRVVERRLVRDELDVIRATVATLVDSDAVQVVITTGGTGITSRDVTPEAVMPLVDKDIPGFGELFRMLSYRDVGASTIQSRASAGLCKRTLLFVLPGSTGAVRLAMNEIIVPQMDSRTRPCNFSMLLPRL